MINIKKSHSIEKTVDKYLAYVEYNKISIKRSKKPRKAHAIWFMCPCSGVKEIFILEDELKTETSEVKKHYDWLKECLVKMLENNIPVKQKRY